MTSYVYSVFTPTTPARLNFVERSEVNALLVNALQTPGKQIIVYGESGSGKSTLLQKHLGDWYPDRVVVTRCSNSSTFDTILLDAFDQLDPYYVDSAGGNVSSSVQGSVGAQFLAVKASVQGSLTSGQSSGSKRLLPPQLTAQRLGSFLGERNLCWLLEDFHKVAEDSRQSMSQTFKVFSDMSSQYPTLRIIAVGATDTARLVVRYDREMSNRVAEIQVPLMNRRELAAIIHNGSALMNVGMVAIQQDIISFSSGLPSVCHHLALNSCLAAGARDAIVGQTLSIDSTHLATAVSQYVHESEDSLKALFEVALARQRVRRFDNTRLILAALATGPMDGMTHASILAAIRSKHPDYPAGNLTTYLRELTGSDRGQVVRVTAGGSYRFTEPMFHSYAQILLGVGEWASPELPTWNTLRRSLLESLTLWGTASHSARLVNGSFSLDFPLPDRSEPSERDSDS